MPLRFLCELKKFASVSPHVSSHMAILLRNFCIMLLFAFMAWFEISNEIERSVLNCVGCVGCKKLRGSWDVGNFAWVVGKFTWVMGPFYR